MAGLAGTLAVAVALHLPAWGSCYSNTSCPAYFRLRDRCNVAYGTVIRASFSASLCTCLHRCHRDDRCHSTTFDDRNNECVTNAGQTSRFSDECVFKLTYADVVKSNCRGVHNGDCRDNSDCGFDNSHCDGFTHMCQCDKGFRFNPANVTCVHNCEVYGSTFELINRRRLRAPDRWADRTMSLDEATAECVHTTGAGPTGRCLAFDHYDDNNASFSSDARGNAKFLKYEERAKTYVRNCE